MDDIRPSRQPKPQTSSSRPSLAPVGAGQKPRVASPPIRYVSQSAGRLPVAQPASPPDVVAANEPPQPLQKRSKKRLIWGVIITLLLALIGAAAVGLWWYNDALLPRSTSESRINITVAPGSTLEQTADLLQQNGAIKSSLAFQLYARQHSKTSIKAGMYLILPTQRPADVLEMLVEGRTDTYNLTILPGKTLKGIKDTLVKDGFDAAAIDAAYAKTYDHPLLASKPAGVSLEGYIFPETYNITSDTTPEQLFVRTFDEFYKRIQAKGVEAALRARGFTLHQGITLASIAQKEVSNEMERRQVAQVFERRLEIGMPLGSDVTFMYAAELLDVEPSVNLDSPYNTRRYGGLPPGAIANFNFSALEAVANPATGDYLYFVSGDDGVTHFSRTVEEHNQNVARYCTKLCQ